ncbi:fimbrial protein [Pseudomonas sp. A34-9]|uniref:fimbrial protein n=1 Tax=Pseudomonas sp. A34-9 TaxID=3034675 RepID=UPI00240DA5C7|nr:fimbrial protein [Pseudomonas sp. A34-9]
MSVNNNNSEYICDITFGTGIVSFSGESGNTQIFKLGNIGVGFQWLAGSSLQILGGYPDNRLPAGTYKAASAHQLKLVKIGPIENGAYISGSGSRLANWKVAESLIPMKLNVTGMVIQNLSCETPDVKVTMGREVLSAISTVGGTATVTSFQIPVNNCPDGIKNVTYSLSPVASSPALDTGRGIIRLNLQSTAKGAAIQITDDAGMPVVFNKAYPLKGYFSSGGNHNIPLSAKYVRSPVDTGGSSELKPGTANAEIAFIIEYL